MVIQQECSFMDSKNKISLLLVFLVYAVLNPSEAKAYLDPGTGSMIVQTLIALFGSCGYAMFLFREKIKKFFDNFRKNGRHD